MQPLHKMSGDATEHIATTAQRWHWQVRACTMCRMRLHTITTRRRLPRQCAEPVGTAQAEQAGAVPWWHGMRGDSSTQPLPQVGQLLRVRTLAGTPAETTARLYAVDPVSHHLALLHQVCE